MKNTISLEEVINIESFQKIQDDIAKATDTAIIMVDYTGRPITSHSNCTKFCSRMREIKEYSVLCEKCDSRGGIESARTKKAYIYKCHKGIVDFAVPIIVGDQYLGAIMAGQILVEDDESLDLEEIVRRNTDFRHLDDKTSKELEEEYKKLPTVNFEKIKAIAQMMFHTSNYIVQAAASNKLSNEAIRKVTFQNNNESTIDDGYIDSEENMNVNLKTNENDDDSPIIKAIEYIDENIHENITLDKMAFVCNLSQCYFSKLFKKETGLNFVTYLNEKKIAKAKQLLKNTDNPINNIAIDLGFEDCGYFIRLFKKLEGITPKKYRDLYKRGSSI